MAGQRLTANFHRDRMDSHPLIGDWLAAPGTPTRCHNLAAL